MKIKLMCSLILSILILQCGYSQDDSAEIPYNRSIGLDATFINSFLPLDNPIGTGSNYLFHYLEFKKNGKFTKQALDLRLVGSFRDNESEVDQDNILIDVEYKMGTGKRKNAFKKAYLLFGTEFGIDYNLNKRTILDPNDPAEESINTNLEQNLSFLVGPMLGFGYTITKRISLYTEAGFYLRLGYGIDKFESEFRPTSNFKDKSILVSTVFRLPRSLILFYNF